MVLQCQGKVVLERSLIHGRALNDRAQ
jgi:hypothetical protein